MKSLITAILLEALSVIGLAQTPASPAPVVAQDASAAKDPFYIAARAAEKKQDTGTMLTLAKKLVEKYPQSSLAQRCLSDAYYGIGFHDEALSAVKRAIELDSTNVVGWHDLGFILGAQKKTDDAFSALRKAVDLAPDDPLPWSDLGLFYSAQGNADLALQSAKSAGDLLRKGRFNDHTGEMTESFLLYSVGYVYAFNQRGADALPYLKKALTLEPESANTWFALSIAYASQGMRNETLSALQQTLKLKPDHEQAKMALQTLTAAPPPAQQQASQPTMEEMQQMVELAKEIQELKNLQQQRRQSPEQTQEYINLNQRLNELQRRLQ